MLTAFFQDSDFIVVLQTGFGSGFLPLGSGLESDKKNLSPNTSGVHGRGETGSGVPESTPAGFCVFLSDPDLKSKICKKTDHESLFHFGSSRSLCGHFLGKIMCKLGLDG